LHSTLRGPPWVVCDSPLGFERHERLGVLLNGYRREA
jgi:hypothetical protein